MALNLSNLSVPLSRVLGRKENHRLSSRVFVGSLSSSSLRTNAASSANMNNIDVASYNDGGKNKGKNTHEGIQPLWDDGLGTQSMKDYMEIAMDLIKSDGGPSRWFCPIACGKPIKDAHVLLHLPGLDGTGAGLVVHEKALGKVFHVQCLHIPVWDRTPLDGYNSDGTQSV